LGNTEGIIARTMTTRLINSAELAVLRATLDRAPVAAATGQLTANLESLQVVGRCECGCDSVDFADPDTARRSKPIGDGIGTTRAGGKVGVIVWGTAEAVTGLEIYDLGAGAADLRLPDPESIQGFGTGAA
jgi:hypothetical protein